MDAADVEAFWQHNPCGECKVGSFAKHGGNYQAFFDEYDKFRDSTESHIPTCLLDAIDFNGKRTLEIGLGLGADSEQIIRRGALWSGLDPTAMSIERVRARIQVQRLPVVEFEAGKLPRAPFRGCQRRSCIQPWCATPRARYSSSTA